MTRPLTIVASVLTLPFWGVLLLAGFIWPTSKVWRMAMMLLVVGSMAAHTAQVPFGWQQSDTNGVIGFTIYDANTGNVIGSTNSCAATNCLTTASYKTTAYVVANYDDGIPSPPSNTAVNTNRVSPTNAFFQWLKGK